MIRKDQPVTTLFILVNVIVFILWHTVDTSLMEDHFQVSWKALLDGRVWVLLTSVFSHITLLHLFVNMFVLNSFGRFLEQFLGAKFYFVFFIVAGIVASFSHAALSNFLLGHPGLPAVGASGAIAGLVLLFSLVFPKEKIMLFAVLPLPALVGAMAFVGLDLWGLAAQVEGGGLPIGHGAHLGGSLTGLLTYFIIVRPRLRRSRMLRD